MRCACNVIRTSCGSQKRIIKLMIRSQSPDLRTETKCPKFRHNSKELMKESHTKDKGDIGLDRKGLALVGTSL